MKKVFIHILFFLGLIVNVMAENNNRGDNRHTISGHITDQKNGELLAGATVYIKETGTGATSDIDGFYSVSLPPGEYHLTYSFLGYQSQELFLYLNKDTILNIEMALKQQQLKEVVIESTRKDANVRKIEMGVSRMDMETVKKIPAIMGETDLIKALQLLPGVQFVSEGSSGFTVRGGSPDQNLLLLDQATVYNASHLLGFFSIFNNDAIRDVKLYKGNIPASAGGRLSSLIDVRMKEGNSKQFSGNGGLGTVSSRLTFEGPLIRDEASFLLSGRRSYADLFLALSSDEDVRNNTLYFYDLNGKANYKINDKNQIYVSGYYGKDVFSNPDFMLSWGNTTATISWNHIFSKKISSNFSFMKSNYDYQLGIPEGTANSFVWQANLNDYAIEADFAIFPNPKNTLRFGLQTIYHRFYPGKAEGLGEESFFDSYEVERNNSLESSVFIENEQEITETLSLRYGLRFTLFNNVGSATIYNFDADYNVIDSTTYTTGNFYNNYSGLEPRIGVRYQLNEVSSVKASYSRTRQYIHRESNSTSGTPLDIWFPSSPNIGPQMADQVSVGYFRNFRKNTIETSVEFYFKKMNNIVDFKDNAMILLNKEYEGEIRIGEGTAYGVEFYSRFDLAPFSGWISYTYARSERTVEGINDGKTYLSPYDRPHDVTLVMNYDINKQLSVGLNWVYMTGNPVTFPTGRVEIGGKYIPIYSERNTYRMPDYHRMDFSLTFKGKDKPSKRFHSEWNFSVYNAYARKNAWVINFIQDENDPNVTYAEKTYLFSIIPSLTYNFFF
jgi:outer membrane receptor for ferrienterochelin and colicin